MTAMAHEADLDLDSLPDLDRLPDLDGSSALDEVLWQAWKALELPDGYRAEIVEGFIEVSPTGGGSHSLAANRLRRGLDAFLAGSEFAAHQDTNLLFGRRVCIPDVLVTLEDLGEVLDPDGIGAVAERVVLVADVVSPGKDARERDLVRKRRAYAAGGIPVYVVIDDYDDGGHVTVLTAPDPEKAAYRAEVRMPYGTEVTIPEGPAKGLVIGVSITGKPREA